MDQANSPNLGDRPPLPPSRISSNTARGGTTASSMIKIAAGGGLGIVLTVLVLMFGFGWPDREQSSADAMLANADRESSSSPARLGADEGSAGKVTAPNEAPPAGPGEKSASANAPSPNKPEPTGEAAATNDGSPADSEAQATPWNAESAKWEVPSTELQAELSDEVEGIFRRGFAEADTPVKKASLAADLKTRAGEVQDNPPARFVMLRLAYDLALAGGDYRLGESIAQELIDHYRVDPLGARTHFLTEIAKTAHSDTNRRLALERGFVLVDELTGAKRFDSALGVLTALEELEQHARLANRPREAQSTRIRVENQKAEWAGVQAARETLTANPEDPKANLTYGRYLCLVEGEWGRGLPLLAKCADPAIRSAAESDLSDPHEPGERINAADAWYEVAKTDRTLIGFFTRARWWYERAMETAAGLDKLKASQRLEEIAKLDSVQPAPSASVPNETPHPEKVVDDPDRKVPAQVPRRSLWVSKQGGYFQRLHDGTWIEKVPNGVFNFFSETGRTAEYVELSRPEIGPTVVQLYEDRCMVKSNRARAFAEFYRGHWHTE